MPKATTTETTEAPKRAPRRRVAKVVTPEEGVVKRAVVPRPRRKAPTKLESESESFAPTSTNAPLVKVRRGLYVKAGLLVASFAVAAVIGYSDEGQINIKGLIEERNAVILSDNAAAQSKAGEGEIAPVTAMIPVQNTTSDLPDGGLRSTDALPTPQPEAMVSETIATTTASSTDEVASSTENGTETSETTPVEGEAETGVPAQ